jgi:hypothetical protein
VVQRVQRHLPTARTRLPSNSARTRDVTSETPPREVVRRALEPRSRSTAHGDDEKAEAPLHWPSLAALAAQQQWPELRRWVEALRVRYKGLDSYVVPACWYEHESLVMALQALKDHERVAYAKSSPASSGTDWHRAYRDMTVLLRQFSADLRCGHGPESAEERAFEMFVLDDIAHRRRKAATVALGQ